MGDNVPVSALLDISSIKLKIPNCAVSPAPPFVRLDVKRLNIRSPVLISSPLECVEVGDRDGRDETPFQQKTNRKLYILHISPNLY